MARRTRFVCLVTFTALCAMAIGARLLTQVYQPFEALSGVGRTLFAEPVSHMTGACSVSPLDPIDDPAAQHIEASLTSTVDVDDMTPAMARALSRFQLNVEKVGGTVTLKSAYRPAAYQKHLQNVWYKWMNELRYNPEPGCQDLRAEVQLEFLRHRLIETQHPVAVSDHTRGLAFDATVDLPNHARLGRRRVNVDTLARLAGLRRPAIAADPVHFKYVGAVNPRALMRRKRTA